MDFKWEWSNIYVYVCVCVCVCVCMGVPRKPNVMGKKNVPTKMAIPKILVLVHEETSL